MPPVTDTTAFAVAVWWQTASSARVIADVRTSGSPMATVFSTSQMLSLISNMYVPMFRSVMSAVAPSNLPDRRMLSFVL